MTKNLKTIPLLVPNDSAIPAKQLPWVTAKIEDTATWRAEMTVAPFFFEDLVSHKTLMTAFADPKVGPFNLSNIWESNLEKLLGDNKNHEEDPALDIAQNRSPSGLAATTLHVAFKGTDVPVHVILNTKTDKGLIVGESIHSGLSAAFNKAGITYVNRNTKIAPVKVEKALDELLAGLKPEARISLRDAFGYRNDILAKDQRPLPALLLAPDVEQTFIKYPVRNRALRA